MAVRTDLIHPWRQIDNYVIVIIGSVCGNSSAVEHRLAKAGVASSNLVSRSNFIWRHSQAVRQRSAKPLSPVRFRMPPPYFRWKFHEPAGVAELADARYLKSLESWDSYLFDSGPRHQKQLLWNFAAVFYCLFLKWICLWVNFNWLISKTTYNH